MHKRSHALLLSLGCLLSGAGGTASAVDTQALADHLSPRLQARSSGVLRTYLRLLGQAAPEDASSPPPRSEPLPVLLVIADQQNIELLEQIICCSPTGPLPTPLLVPVQAALDAFRQAGAQLSRASSDASVRYLVAVVQTLAQAQAALDQALAIAAQVEPAAIPLLLPAVQKVREAAHRNLRGLIDLALAAGVSPPRLAAAEEALRLADALDAAGDHGGAMLQYASGLGFVADTVVFSMARFEQNLRSVFDTESVGWAYALSQGGQLARSGANGSARLALDAPARAQSATRKMHIASVSKTLSAVALQRLLADQGLGPDSLIAPWLPSNWAFGPGIESITFRELMTHRSGFGQRKPAGSSFEHLRTMIAFGVGAGEQKSFDYNNANFGLLRVLAARLQGIDVGNPAYAQADGGALTAAMYLTWAQGLYGAIGVDYTCEPSRSAQTIEYNFPYAGGNGFAESPMSLACGGFGSFMSATDLARVMAFLRYGDSLLDASHWQQMKSGYLGFMNPNDHHGYTQGLFGNYFAHGGDWDHAGQSANGGLDACMMVFPINVEAAVLVNSSNAGYSHGGYQCAVLAWAFENAWVPN